MAEEVILTKEGKEELEKRLEFLKVVFFYCFLNSYEF